MVYFMENPNLTWMMTVSTPISRNLHMLHVWYIYLHHWVIFRANVGYSWLFHTWSRWDIVWYSFSHVRTGRSEDGVWSSECFAPRLAMDSGGLYENSDATASSSIFWPAEIVSLRTTKQDGLPGVVTMACHRGSFFGPWVWGWLKGKLGFATG